MIMKKNFFIFVTIFFSLLCLPLPAQEQETVNDNETVQVQETVQEQNSVQEQEADEVMSLFAIERLIRQTDYSEALKQLNLYIEKKPEYFDNAQRLIKIIMNRRKQYSVLAEKAIKSSTENPEDHETPAKIILQMRGIEKNPPAEIKRMIDMLEEMHLFKYYAYLFDTILDQSAQLSQNEEYNAAIDKVRADGFDIYKDEFYDSQALAQTQIPAAMDEILVRLNANVDRYKENSFHKDFDSLTAQFLKAVNSSDYDSAAALFPELKASYSAYADLRNKVYECGNDIKELYELQKQTDPSVTDASYLPFMQRFVLGQSSQPDSGILGAIDCKYAKNVESIKAAVEKVVVAYSNNYLKNLPSDILADSVDYAPLSDSGSYVKPIQNFSSLGKNVNALYSLLQAQEDLYNPNPSYDTGLDYEAQLAELTRALVQNTAEYKKEREVQTNLLSAGDAINATVLVTRLFDSVSRMSRVLGVKSKLLPSAFEWGQKYEQALEQYTGLTGDYISQWSEHTQLYNSYLDRLFEHSASTITDSWDMISQSYKNDADTGLSALEQIQNAAAVFSKGFDEHLSNQNYTALAGNPSAQINYASALAPQNNPVYFYPELENNLYEHIQNSCAQYNSDLTEKQNALTQNLNSHEDWLKNQALVDIVESAVSYIQNVKSRMELISVNAGMALSENNLKLDNAAYAKNFADSIIEEAKEAYTNGQLDKAEKLLVEASEKYAESLAIADSYELRNQADSIKIELSTKIMDAKNELVVKQSRELYTQARDALNYDRYDDSQTLINAAINKWAETHTEKNPEFEDFLELVNTAVSMKTGRTLLPSDPLYSEMSQLLSIAYQFYDEGEQKLKTGDKPGAETALNSAVENLNKFKNVYPLNQEASLLLLKIERLRDPVRFEEEFAQKVQAAIAQSKNKDTKAQAYNTLTDYYNLEPNYKGLKDLLYNLEIELGMRQKPVDNSDAARSTRLTTQAERQFNSAGNNTAKLEQALATVNEALKINPNNKSAQSLKDRISLKIGSSSIIVLSSSDQNLLTQAKKAYQAGNIDDANTYMLRLLNSNPDNIKVKEVSDLNNKIKSQL